MQNIFIELLPPWIETGLQPAFYDKESGTVLQQVSRMWAKMIELGKAFNNFSEDTAETVNDYIERFTTLYNYVHDYFDNLDVQEEVNNKLDQMVQDGTLQEIIGEYLNATAVWGFDTVADMKASTNLINGSFAKTLGYHTKGDGGAGMYKIRNITNDDVVDEGKIIEIGDAGNNLIAELMIGDSVTPEQFGAYGDGTHDDHDAIALAFSHCKVVNFIQSKTYLTGSTLTLTYQMILNGNNSLIIGNSDGNYPVITVDGSTSPAWHTKININDLKIKCGSGIDDRVHEGILFYKAADFTIRNVFVQFATNGFHFKNSLIFQFENSHVQNTNCALYCSEGVVNNVKFDKCTFVANKYVLNSVNFAFKNAMFINCEIELNTSDNDDAVIIIPGKQHGTGGSSLIFEGCWFEANAPRDILTASDYYTPISVTNCYITHPANTAYSFAKGTDENFSIILQNCQDITAYINSGKTIEASTSNYVAELNCLSQTSPYAQAGVIGAANNFGTMNKASIHEITLLQNGSTKKGKIKAYSDYVNISANETIGVRLDDNNYLHPFVISNIYLWVYLSKLYYKIGSRPESGTDGTVLAG